MKKFNLSTLTILAIIGFSGCSVTPHTNLEDDSRVKINVDAKDIDFSKEMKKSTLCENPQSLDGDLTIMKAAKKGGITKVKYVTKENHFTTQPKFLGLFGGGTKYTQKCITIYGE